MASSFSGSQAESTPTLVVELVVELAVEPAETLPRHTRVPHSLRSGAVTAARTVGQFLAKRKC
ncbi:MAG: hypothetical protein HY865_13425 [Chloroflexi bacterium]|nr:hypothetical protein [Chloroflexota bacterium]